MKLILRGLTITIAEIEITLPEGVAPPGSAAAEKAPVCHDAAGSSAANPIETGIPVSNKSCGGVESLETRAPESPDREWEPAERGISTREGRSGHTTPSAGVAPGPHDTVLTDPDVIALKLATSGSPVRVIPKGSKEFRAIEARLLARDPAERRRGGAA